MPRILGVYIPDDKKIIFSLRYIYGIGLKRAQEIVEKAKIDPNKRAKELTSVELNKIAKILENYEIEGDLRRKVADSIQRLIRIGSYRGSRHVKKLPARGQRTRSNARTVRGRKRQTVGAMTKEMAAKLEQAKKKK